VRLVGESWPLPLKRSFFEYHALTRQEARDLFALIASADEQASDALYDAIAERAAQQ